MTAKLRVVITGASSGIGASMAELFVQTGAEVALAGRRKDRLEKAKLRLDSLGLGKAYAYELDIADATATERVLKQFITEVGGLDVLVD